MKPIKGGIVNYRFFIYLFFILELHFISNAYGQVVLEDSLMNGNNFEKAAFSLWFKSDSKEIRGLLVLVPGSNSDGRSMVYDTCWQNLAVKHGFALLGCYYTDKFHDHMDIEYYADVKNGSGSALLNILGNFSIRSGHPELADIPLAFWGVSAGGEFNYEFVCWKPERVIAFIVNKGGIYYSSLAPAAAWEVPGVFIAGEKDSPYRNDIIKGIFSINRRFGAKWIFAEEHNVGHEFERSEEFARFFFDRVIPLRLPVEPVNAPHLLLKLTDNGYVGLNSSGQLLQDSDSVRNEITSWFPNRQLAEGWLYFIK